MSLLLLQDTMKQSDLAAMSERSRKTFYNPGFIVVKPTSLSVNAYRLLRNITAKSKVTNDMRALTRAIQMLKTQKSGINATFLNKHIYMNGKQYFEVTKRLLPRAHDPCSSIQKINCSVLVVHNNWIVGKEAKIYRFREHLMWLYDGEDQYYSSQTRRYITYTNPNPVVLNGRLGLSDDKQSAKRQLSALITALSIGYMLNRVVIIPKFYCSTGIQCPLNSLIHIRTFDAIFSNQYRENSFVQHPRVPYAVKQSLSNQRVFLAATHSQFAEKVHTITSSDIIKLFRNAKDKVINFGSLDGIHVKFSSHSTGTAFNERIRNAFKPSDYKQFNVGSFMWLKP